MRGKYTGAFCSLLFVLAVPAYADANLAAVLVGTSKSRVEPGESVAFRYDVLNNGPDAATVRLVQPLPAGARLAGWSGVNGTCHESGGAAVCTSFLTPRALMRASVIVTAPDDSAGLVISGETRIESDQISRTPVGDMRWTLTVFHTFTVATADDFGAGSLRDALERANAECIAGALPCKVRFAASMRIAPRAPLPRITACDTIIDGGGYDGSTLNRSFDAPRRVEISGENVSSGSGLVIASRCTYAPRAGLAVQGLAIHSFPENGVAVEEPAEPQVTIAGCSIETNALRGISVAARAATVHVDDVLIAGNARSGVAFWSVRGATLRGNLIGVRFGGAPQPNGGSGVFVNAGIVRSSLNAIEYNRDFGIAVGAGAQHFLSDGDYLLLNGGLPIDWGLDGPTLVDETGRMPTAPRLLDAFYDAARNRTVVSGVIPFDASSPFGMYTVRLYIDALATQVLRPVGSPDKGAAAFDVVLEGDLTGRTLTAQTILSPAAADIGSIDSSEFSAGIRVR